MIGIARLRLTRRRCWKWKEGPRVHLVNRDGPRGVDVVVRQVFRPDALAGHTPSTSVRYMYAAGVGCFRTARLHMLAKGQR